jgi:CDP-diacylglycerol---glycerol-3-phosphate 3-phosphatidyltransferase
MASIYDIKPQFQAFLRPLTDKLAARGITANHVTLAAAGLSIGTGLAILLGREHRQILLLLPIVLFIRMALNAIDGMLAREHNMKSALGALLNELGDAVSDAALYLPLAVVPGFHPWMVVVIVLLAVLTEMAGVVAVQIGATRHYEGPMGKSDRAFVFGALGLALGCGVKSGRWLTVVLALMMVLLVVTVWNRARKALKEIGQ